VYSVDVRNEGTEPADRVTLTDSLPAGVEPLSVQTSQGNCELGATVTCAFGALEQYGGYASVHITTRTAVEGRWENTASIDTDTEDPNPANNSATVLVDIVGPVPRVSDIGITRRVVRPRGRTAFSFVVSKPATVTFSIQKAAAGPGLGPRG